MDLKKGEILVVGFSTREKDGKKSSTLYGIQKFEDWENGKGDKAIIEWTNRCDFAGLKSGDIINPIFARGFQGKAILADYQIVSQK